MKDSKRDYTKLTAIANTFDLTPYTQRGQVQEGLYNYKGLRIPIDLSACAEDAISIIKTVLKQLGDLEEKLTKEIEKANQD
ncbi:MAG: hypothetical protein WC026_13210 [Hyphomicrobium sp.]|uniref:hypothetical protein n=1 Tax=Hyphomicrobium sp. TaxID=82 RepID=UPI0035639180